MDKPKFDPSIFNALSSEDFLSFEKQPQPELSELRPYARMVFSCSRLPRLRDEEHNPELQRRINELNAITIEEA